MATIVTRAGKGSPLTNTEVDANFTNLNTDKAELSGATFTGEITANGGIKITETAGGNFLKFDVDGTADEATVGMDSTDLIISVDPTNARFSSDFVVKNDGTETFRIASNGVATFAGEITANGGIGLGDNDKATFGAGDDLSIYHNNLDGHSYIEEAGLGNLFIDASNLRLRDAAGANMLRATSADSVELYYNAALKLATTSTGIDVTGSVVADGLTVDSGTTDTVALFQSTDFTSRIEIKDSSGSSFVENRGGILNLKADPENAVANSRIEFTIDNSEKMRINNNGDVSFYEDTGTTAKLTWDASAESLNFADNGKATFGAGDALQIFYNGTAGVIKSETANIEVKVNGGGTFKVGDEFANFMLAVNDNADVQLYHGTNPALKLATTATGIDVTGVVTTDGITSSAPMTITTADNAAQITLISTDADASVGPLIDLTRDSASPAASDNLGRIRFRGEDANGDVTAYAQITGKISSTSAGAVDGQVQFQTMRGGVQKIGLNLTATEAVFNESSEDYDFRVESNGDTHALFVEGSSGNVGIGTDSPTQLLTLSSADPRLNFIDTNSTANGATALIEFEGSNGRAGYAGMVSGDLFLHTDTLSAGDIVFRPNNSEAVRITSAGSVGIGTSSPSSYGHSLVVAKDAAGGATYATITNTNANQFLNLGINADVAEITWDNADSLAFGTTAASTNEGQTFEAMRIASSGRVGIGTSSPATALSVVGDITTTGGVYLGGTGAVNKLDDYEAGSFTPVIADAATGGNVASGYGNQRGFYTKVGRLVTCLFDITNIATVGMTGTNDIYIRDLPFTAASHSGAPQFTAPVIGGGTMTSALSLYAALQDNGSYVRLINSNQTAVSAFLAVSNINSGATDLRFSITYFAA